MHAVEIGKDRFIGPGHPTYIIAEIGINHNGSVELAKQLIAEAARAGCDAVKFQKRTPELCVPKDQWEKQRDTPWGRMSYIDYKRRTEFGVDEYTAIDDYCRALGIAWFASCWDEPSVDFIEQFQPVLYKMASASLTDRPLLDRVRNTGRPLMLSTGMSTLNEITQAVEWVGYDKLLIAHSTSAYPCPPQELNLRMVPALQALFPATPIGYSGHETGLATTVAAVALGACFVERHFTLDRAMWGSDHAASVEPGGMAKMVRDIRDVEAAFGDGVKRVYDSELEPRRRLRRELTPNNE
ncbi:N-acetylneuraminate synthase family protein [Hymenobacter sp. BT683]|uniref:N-acetylneuraminate synthase family protein n=1 Tax=Hymenobacter jeongseonensis TaxID=2791027 RepID=A0ABS0IH55_9BACT|nr:N-acetylneuraminate synthase family protein [Hymenobacter jeongseonensis]MBF9237692.1 N-acetylneuraminate synthase family protein [Hymenobacter jeongseonensis]